MISSQIYEMYHKAMNELVGNDFYIAYTANGQNLNGYTALQMAFMFSHPSIPNNIIFEDKFSKLLV